MIADPEKRKAARREPGSLSAMIFNRLMTGMVTLVNKLAPNS
jgi:hypothetical protein